MLTDFNKKDFELMQLGLKRLTNDSADKAYLFELVSYLDDCIAQFEPVKDDGESFNDNRLTNKQRNS